MKEITNVKKKELKKEEKQKDGKNRQKEKENLQFRQSHSEFFDSKIISTELQLDLKELSTHHSQINSILYN